MKKIAVAVSAALLASSALAANVDLYGVVNTGFAYTNTRTVEDGVTKSNKSFPWNQAAGLAPVGA